MLKEMSKVVWNEEVQPSGNFFLQQLVRTSVGLYLLTILLQYWLTLEFKITVILAIWRNRQVFQTYDGGRSA